MKRLLHVHNPFSSTFTQTGVDLARYNELIALILMILTFFDFLFAANGTYI